jgi:hypothetical protein
LIKKSNVACSGKPSAFLQRERSVCQQTTQVWQDHISCDWFAIFAGQGSQREPTSPFFVFWDFFKERG